MIPGNLLGMHVKFSAVCNVFVYHFISFIFIFILFFLLKHVLFRLFSGNVSMGKDLKMGISRHLDLQLEHPVKVPTALVGTNQSIFSDVDYNKFSEARNN